MMVVKVHETFDFPESVTIFFFCLKVSKKTLVLIWIRYQAIFFRVFKSRRTPPKQKGKKERLIAKPEFAKIKVEQKRVNVVLQDL